MNQQSDGRSAGDASPVSGMAFAAQLFAKAGGRRGGGGGSSSSTGSGGEQQQPYPSQGPVPPSPRNTAPKSLTKMSRSDSTTIVSPAPATAATEPPISSRAPAALREGPLDPRVESVEAYEARTLPVVRSTPASAGRRASTSLSGNLSEASAESPEVRVSTGASSPRASAYHRIVIDGDEGDKDYVKCAEIIAGVVQSRQSYKSVDKGQLESVMPAAELQKLYSLNVNEKPATTGRQLPMRSVNLVAPNGDPYLTFDKGIYHFHGMATKHVAWSKYIKDIRAVYGAIENGPCLSTARTRLNTLSEKFQLYSLLNSELESNYDMYVKGGGVYARCTRVDNCIHMKTSVPAPQFLEFVTRMAIDEPNTPLYIDADTKQKVTLFDYLEDGDVDNPQEITIEGLGLHPTLYRNKFLPYDMFNETLNPSGAFGAKLLQAVLSTNGPNNGDICGTLVRTEMEKREYQQRQVVATEMSLEIFGHNKDEVYTLAKWVSRQGFHSFTRNRWILAISTGRPHAGPNALESTCLTIGDRIRNIFYPLIMATLYTRDAQWQEVAQLLAQTSAISVETLPVTRTQNFFNDLVDPDTVRYEVGCSEYYLLYFIWNNVVTLNALRVRMGLNTFKFNTAVREPAPAFDQLVCGFLLGDVVYDASSLNKSWIMQYLYVYSRIGVVMSPLADNVRSTAYFDHPIVSYLQQGMLVSLATSDPLYFHHRTEQPLLEEYATLMKLRSLAPMDLCELARNSVINSNFPVEVKRQWLGDDFTNEGDFGNDITRSSVCRFRLQYRHEALVHEETLLNSILKKAAKKGQTPMTVNAIPFSGSVQLADKVEQFRHARRMNYTDNRIVYPRIDVYGSYSLKLAVDAVSALRQTLLLRNKYTTLKVVDVNVEDVFVKYKSFDEDMWEYNNYYGVFLLSRVGKSPAWPAFIPTIQEFMRDVDTCRGVVSLPALRRLAMHRLNLLERKFLLHLSMNIYNEAGVKEQKEWNNRDFFTAHKVDNNVFTDSGINARTLLEFFQDKAQNHGEDVVFEEENSPVTLRQLLERSGINVAQITVDELNHQISNNTDLRSIFLSPHNFMQGRYFAELTKRTLQIYKEDAYVFAENRLMLYGESVQEWYQLAHWFDRYGMASSQNRWIVCIPRSYRRLKKEGKVANFGQFLDHVFKPLWEISLHPASDTKFHYFLAHTSGFDCCDDESKIDLPLSNTYPHDWRTDLNPPYNMYLYYIWANLASLNEFRASRGLGTFSFRPQCGERGGLDHLIGGFLLANGISHGVTLAHHPVLEFLYYITQLGVTMSPLSNTAGASAYLENPFPIFFHRGLNVSLSTNKPLYFHFTREPLVEEYSIAAKLWKFEFNDLSEIAHNSVLQSGYPPAWKENSLGPLYHLRSTLGNDVRRTRVSDVRVAYRYEVYHTELNFLDEQLSTNVTPLSVPRAMRTLEEEAVIYQRYIAQQRKAESIQYLNASGSGSGSNGHDDGAGAGGEAREALGEASGSVQAASPEDDGLGDLAKADKVQADIRILEQQLRQLTVLSQRVSGENSAIAKSVVALRERLKTEGYLLHGNVASSVVRPPTTVTPTSTTPTSGAGRNPIQANAFEFSLSGTAVSRPAPPAAAKQVVAVPQSRTVPDADSASPISPGFNLSIQSQSQDPEQVASPPGAQASFNVDASPLTDLGASSFSGGAPNSVAERFEDVPVPFNRTAMNPSDVNDG